jgi:hypothetical protein
MMGGQVIALRESIRLSALLGPEGLDFDESAMRAAQCLVSSHGHWLKEMRLSRTVDTIARANSATPDVLLAARELHVTLMEGPSAGGRVAYWNHWAEHYSGMAADPARSSVARVRCAVLGAVMLCWSVCRTANHPWDRVWTLTVVAAINTLLGRYVRTGLNHRLNMEIKDKVVMAMAPSLSVPDRPRGREIADLLEAEIGEQYLPNDWLAARLGSSRHSGAVTSSTQRTG